MSSRLAHPVSELWSAVFHSGFASWFGIGIVLCSLGVWFHSIAARRHWRDRL